LGDAGAFIERLTVGSCRHILHAPARSLDEEIATVESATVLVRIAIERSGFKAGLQAGKERFQALIENTSDVISILDRKDSFNT